MTRGKERFSTRRLVAKPLTPDRWRDFEALFGPRGACGGCWCMYWREAHAEFERLKGEGNRRAMQRLVRSGEAPGIIGYVGNEPVAWCSIAPRERYARLDRSRILKRIDDEPVWSVVCFYIAKSHRKLGISLTMLEEAVRYAASEGARIVEGYPIDPKKGMTADVFAYTGLVQVFLAAGFTEVTRRSETRPIMRRSTGRGAGMKRATGKAGPKRASKAAGPKRGSGRGAAPKGGGDARSASRRKRGGK